MSDTPETDALREAIDNGAAVEAEMTSLARKLEQERDDYKEAFEIASRSADDQMFEKRDAERERDEARAERDEACQVANGLAKQVERLRKERDQLKEALLIMENLLKPGIELFPEIGEILKQGGAK